MTEIKLNIIYEDNDIIVINKQPGLLSLPDRFRKEILNLRTILHEKFGEIFVVHRLDKDTSGLIVFAKNAQSHRDLSIQFQEGLPKRIYHVVVSGIFRQDEMEIDIPIIQDPTNPSLSIPSARGKESRTKVKVIERFKNCTLLECELLTGRHHQIRVHCGALGHPLLVDSIYGNNSEFYLSSIKRKFRIKKDEEEKPIISRVTMHSYQLGFNHPKDNNYLAFTADYPKDFKALINVLKKYNI